MNYQDIIGHKIEIESLQRAVKKGHISHFYLFEGEKGIGKMTTAKVFAKHILCRSQNSESPCGVCASCRKFESGSHPDYIEIAPTNGIIRKNEIDNIKKQISFSPFESARKVILIDDADKMNKESQNALLKILEEPPSYINLILISSNTKLLLNTILSRAEKIHFKPINASDMVNFLTNKENIALDRAKLISDYSQGSIGKAFDLIKSEEFILLRDDVLKLVDYCIFGRDYMVFEMSENFTKNKEISENVLLILLLYLRDLFIYKSTQSELFLINKDKIELIKKHSILEFDKINDIIEKIYYTKESIDLNVNKELLFEALFFSIQEEY
ncbi:MAG: DNA polymerase III subunit delta' [Tissierellales bacterium]|nr:DNA polymerase III subunit delta' [Tissierellales bacterium]